MFRCRNQILCNGNGALAVLASCLVSLVTLGAAVAAADPVAQLKQTYSQELAQRAQRLGIKPGADGKLLDHTQQFLEPKLVPLGGSVHAAVGYDYSVYAFIEAPEGVIAVDTGWFMPHTERALADYRQLVDKPIRAIIYTHTHGDHVGGSAALVPPDKVGGIEVIGPRGWRRNVQYEVESGGKIYRRAFAQFGALLPVGPEGNVSTGLGGPLVIGPSSTAYNVTHEVLADVEEYEIAGTKLVLVNAGGDIPENLMIYAPDSRTLFVGDILDGCLVPMATARWEPERQARTYQHSLEMALEMFPDVEHLVSGHGRTTSGNRQVRQRLQNARDIVKYTADVVQRSVTQGLSPDRIIEQIRFPSHLAQDPDLQPYYHRLDWIIRGMYTKLGGWTTDINSLTRLTDTEEARHLVAAMGGTEKVLELGRLALADGDYRWAVTLATYLLRVDGGNAAAGELKNDGLLGLAYQTRSANERNYALTEIVQPPWSQVLAPFLTGGLATQSTADILAEWPLQFDAGAAIEDVFTVQLQVEGEEDGTYYLTCRNGVIDVHPGRTENAGLSITMNREALIDLTTGRISVEDARHQGLVRVRGEEQVYSRFASLYGAGV